MKFLLRMVVAAFTLIAITYIGDGALLEIEGMGLSEQLPSALFAALVLAFVNATIKPIVKLIALPLRILTLGLFGLVINAGMFYIVSWAVKDFILKGFWRTVLAALIMSVVMAIATRVIDRED